MWAAPVAALATLVIGFLWYSLLFARPWMVLMGYDPDDKAKLGEDAEGCGPDVSPITGGRRALGGRAGKIIAIATVDTALYGNEDRARRMVGICDHGAADQRPFHQAASKALGDQYRLSAGMLSGDGRDSRSLAIKASGGIATP